MKRERWRPVKGYTGIYEVSSLGRVRSLDRTFNNGRWKTRSYKKGKLLTAHPNWYGHLHVCLSKDGKSKTRCIHHLVADAFLGPKPTKHVVRHGPEGKTVNTIDNLSYGTRSEDRFDQYRDGTFTIAKPVRCSNGCEYRSAREAARQLGLDHSHISEVCRKTGRQYKHGGFTWEYINV